MTGISVGKAYASVRREGGRMARFGGVGVANTAADFIVFAGLIAVSVAPVIANIAGFLVANTQSYFLNSKVTFRREGRSAPMSFPGYGRFVAAHAFSLVVSSVMILLLADKIGALPAKASAMGFTFLWNYTTSALFVFKPGKRS